MSGRTEAIAAAGEIIAPALRSLYGLDGTSVEEAALAALAPGGPTLPELTERIRALRNHRGSP